MKSPTTWAEFAAIITALKAAGFSHVGPSGSGLYFTATDTPSGHPDSVSVPFPRGDTG